MKNNTDVYISLSFFCGVLLCFVSVQFEYFEIKKELDVPNIIFSILTLILGTYIAINLQKKASKSQNQHTFLINKIDITWNSFNEITQPILYKDTFEIQLVKRIMKDVVYPLSYLSNVFESFNMDNKCITNLSNELENFEKYLSNLNAKENVLNISSNKVELEKRITEINRQFGVVLIEIERL